MSPKAACPPLNEFERMVKHSAAPELSEQLLQHLETCPSCWETVGPLLDDDKTFSDIAAARSEVTPDLFGRLLAIRSSERTAEFGAMSVTPAEFDPGMVAEADPPKTVGHYQLLRLLGRGGMGAVYLAIDTRLNRQVALKIMLPRFCARPEAKERFLREARAAAQINHDNVVTIYEADERDGIPYIAMQFLQGASLEDHLKSGSRFTVAEILRIAGEIASGLAAAHRIGLIHRDIKPGNLWLEANTDRIRVLDFGLAKPTDTEAELTGSGMLIGTPAFMSPEQGRGKKLDARTDLFSLGAVLYRLCTGRLPFDGPTTMAVLTSLGIDDPPQIRQLNPEIPEPMSKLIHELLMKNPDNRPPSAAEVVDRFERIASGATEPGRKIPSGPRWRIAAGLMGVFAVLAGIVIIIKNKDGSETKIDVPAGATVTVKDGDGQTLAAIMHLSDSDWEKSIAGLKGQERFAAVAARLTVLNPRFNASSMIEQIENGEVVALEVRDASDLANLAPFHVLTGLRNLYIHGGFRNPADIGPLRGLKLASFQANGCPIKDLSPLAGMPLTLANFWGNTTADLSPLRGMKLVSCNVGHSPTKDISVLKGMPLEDVCLNLTPIDDLSPLIGAPLKRLTMQYTKVTDLTPLANMPLDFLSVLGSPIKDYSPLRTLPLTWLQIDDPKKHVDILRSIHTLKMLNTKPVAEILGGDK